MNRIFRAALKGSQGKKKWYSKWLHTGVMGATLGWADYLVCGIMLLISISIGIYYRFTGDKQRTNQEYLLADRKASMVAVAFSLMATFMSSITLMGVSAENYSYGTQFVVINISYGIFTPVAAYLYLPVFFKLQATSAYEYLERRFGVWARVSTSVAFSLQMILYMGIVVYAPAIALETVTGLNKVLAILVIGIVCTFYATIGGMKAVLTTDVFQSLLMFAAVFCVVISALVDRGGFGAIWEIAESHGRIEFLNFSPDPITRHTWWSLNIGGGLTFLSLYAVNQAQVQRYLSVRDLKTAQKSLFLNWPILSLLSLSTSFAGLAIFSLYADCDPVLTKRIDQSDQIMPLYALDALGHLPGLPGLFVAGIFSGALSTVSGALNSLAAVTVEDYIKPIVKRCTGEGLKERTAAFWTKILCLIYGGCCLAVAFAAQYLGAILQAALTIFGVVGGPVLGIFTLGMFFPMANELGAVSGLIVGLSFCAWIGFGGPKPPPPILPTWASEEACDPAWGAEFPPGFHNGTTPANTSEYFYLYRISYQWGIVLGLLLTLFVGLIVSWCGSRSGFVMPTDPHPDLFIPPVARRLRKKLENSADIFDVGNHKSVIILKRISTCNDENLKEKIMGEPQL